MGTVNITTDRLVIREYRPEDIEKHHALISDPEIMYYVQDVETHSRAESEENLKLCLDAVNDPDRKYVFVVMEERATGAYIGGIGYTVMDANPAGRRCEMGYFSYKEFWGRGYMTEALSAMLEYAFTKDNVYRMDMTCIKDNRRSARVMEKCGLIYEGERKDFEWHHERLKSRLYFGLLRDEWMKQHGLA